MKVLKIGTRKDEFSYKLCENIIADIEMALPDFYCVIVPITTHEDLYIANGGAYNSNMFIPDIEIALLEQQIDLAVINSPDLRGKSLRDCTMYTLTQRLKVNDAFVSLKPTGFDPEKEFTVAADLPLRIRQIKSSYKLLKCVKQLGNTKYKLDKLKSHEYDAVVLSLAEVETIELDTSNEFDIFPIPLNKLLPVTGQGISVVCCKDGNDVTVALNKAADADNQLCFDAQRLCEASLATEENEAISIFAQISEDIMNIKAYCYGNKYEVEGKKNEYNSLVDNIVKKII